jgi:hypothetical protein
MWGLFQGRKGAAQGNAVETESGRRDPAGPRTRPSARGEGPRRLQLWGWRKGATGVEESAGGSEEDRVREFVVCALRGAGA